MRLDGVEVKVSLDSGQTADAVTILGLSDVPPWSIHFVEDVTAGLCDRTPLLDEALILRARRRATGKDDVTVKFRPGRRSRLTDVWLGTGKSPDAEFKVEADWAGERRTLAVSLTADRPKGLVAAVSAGERNVGALFTDDQKRLIEDCVGRVNLSMLTMLPAISAMRWPTFAVTEPGGPTPGRPELDVRAERWTVRGLDFLELPISVEPDAAMAAQEALSAFVARKGLVVSAAEAKTTQVLRHLIAAVAC